MTNCKFIKENSVNFVYIRYILLYLCEYLGEDIEPKKHKSTSKFP